VVAVIHSTLHPPHVLSRLLPQQQHGQNPWSPFNAAVFVRPNDGTISDELACEVHVVKMSAVTGKVAEDRDFFVRKAPAVRGDAAGVLAQGPQYSLLAPVAKMNQATADSASTAVLAAATTSATFGAQPTGPTSHPTNSSNSSSASITHATATATATVAAATTSTNRRLITFDSTDPEFDDDSDPDADLDL
jgi:hypothetical protein